MRGFSKINPSVWGSKRFESLTDDAKLFYLYCLTSPQSNSVGCYRNPVGYMMVDLNWNEARIKTCLKKVSDTLLIQYHEEESVVLIDRWFEYNPASNPKHALKLVQDVEAIPYPNFAAISARALKRCIEDRGWKIEDNLINRIDRVSRLGDTKTKTETKTETETETYTPLPPSQGEEDDFTDDFSDFWAGWIPHEMSKGSDKKTTQDRYTKARKTGVTHEEIINQRDRYLQECREINRKSLYAATWLNERNKNKWEFEVDDTRTTSNNQPRPSARPSIADAVAMAQRDSRRPFGDS